jgi:hypothetical protein
MSDEVGPKPKFDARTEAHIDAIVAEGVAAFKKASPEKVEQLRRLFAPLAAAARSFDSPSKPAPPKPAGPGPKPSGPSHPSPSGPPHGNDHALPPLDEVVLSARILGEQLINALGRDYDPASASDKEAWPGLTEADLHLAKARSKVREALREVAALARLRLAAGNAADRVMFPDRPVRNPGEGLTPGLAAGSPPARESSHGGVTPVRAGANVTAPPT